MLGRQRGLTLVELMVVVAVMAIVATIAYPIYTAQVQKTRRADAKIALEVIAQAQERFYTINGEYTGNLGSLQIPTAMQGGTSDRGYYNLSVAVSGTDNEQFTATASASGSSAQADDTDCAQFTIDHLGLKKDFASGDSENNPSACW